MNPKVKAFSHMLNYIYCILLVIIFAHCCPNQSLPHRLYKNMTKDKRLCLEIATQDLHPGVTVSERISRVTRWIESLNLHDRSHFDVFRELKER